MSFPVKAVVFDWAGTMVDFGCMAPVEALIEVFAGEGVALSDDASAPRHGQGQARSPDARSWPIRRSPRAGGPTKGAPSTDADIERLYQKLGPAMTAAASQALRALIPGAAETVAALRRPGRADRLGHRLYPRDDGRHSGQCRRAQGYAPEMVVCAGETPSGRPAPLMTWKALIALDAWPARACIKVDDAAGRHRGGPPGGLLDGRVCRPRAMAWA